MEWTYGILSMVGLSLGSFLNVCLHRIPRGIPLATIGSFCPHCKRELRWYELVPVMSFALQRGRCRSCSSRIPIQYALVEVLVAVFALLLFGIYGLSPQIIVSFSFISLMMLVAIIDWRYLIIPNKVVIGGLVIGVGLKMLCQRDDLVTSIVAAMVSFGTMLVMRIGGNWLFKKETMGMGDVKLAAVIGLFIGLQGFLIALWSAAVVGSIVGISKSLAGWPSTVKQSDLGREEGFLRPEQQARNDKRLPLGSFLAITSTLVLFFQDSINSIIGSWLTWMQ